MRAAFIAIPDPAPWRKICVRRVDREAVGAQQVGEHLARPDAGQLVGVADEQEMRAGGDRLGELVGEQDVEHAHLVDHDEIGLQRAVLVVPRLAPRPQLEEAVERARRQPGRLLHPLGGAAGGGGEQGAQPLGAGEREDRAQGVRLARARPARQDRDRGGERHPHRRLLRRAPA